MRKYSTLLLPALSLSVLTFVFSSCKDDDEPPVKPKLSFASLIQTVNESDGTIEIQVVLDKAATEDITIDYSLTGTALDDVAAGTSAPADYEIVGDYGEVEIEAGQTSGIIEIELYSDFEFEGDETIEITIEDVDSEGIEITRDDEIVITVEQEDGLIVILEWPAPSANGTADMDIILRVGQNITTWEGVLNGAAEGSVEGPEVLFLPKVVTYPAYGLSYVYYDGTLDPLEFVVTFVDFADGVAEPVASRESFEGVYTAVNKNKWTDPTTTIVVQTFEKTGGAFTSPSSPIVVPPAGSRIGSSDNFVSSFKKQTYKTEKFLNALKRLN